MKSAFRAGVLFAAFAALAVAEKFEVRYFHDEPDSTLLIRQIEFPSAGRGFAIGTLTDERRETGVVVVTSDGGRTWSTVRLDDIPVSVYCLDETACWLVALRGIWFSDEGGRQWRRLSRERGILRTWFTTRERGWAVGPGKKLVETRDGGKSWKKMAIAEKFADRSNRLTFGVITFVDASRGLITGRSEPVQRGEDSPIWMQSDPEVSREAPTLSVAIETRDGGETWTAAESSMFGRIGALEPAKDRPFALALLEFDRYFDYASDVMKVNFTSGGSESVFRMKGFAATDVEMASGTIGYIAGFVPPGRLARTPVPGKVQVFRSGSDLKLWTSIPVDYRAVARQVSLAVAPDEAVWIATDIGMILKLVP